VYEYYFYKIFVQFLACRSFLLGHFIVNGAYFNRMPALYYYCTDCEVQIV